MSNDAPTKRSASDRDARGCFTPGNPHRWSPGQSGNAAGRRKGVSLARALARQAVKPVSGREEMAKIARTIGLDPDEAKNIDVVAALFYTALSRMLLRAATGTGRADERLVGMMQVLLKALDGDSVRVSGPDGGPIPIAAVVANVQAALGMRAVEVVDGDDLQAIASDDTAEPRASDTAGSDVVLGEDGADQTRADDICATDSRDVTARQAPRGE